MTENRDGKSPETAFIIEDSSGEFTASIGNFVDRMFGGNDSSYFILSETTMEKKEVDKRYKVLYVEDSVGDKHTLFFEIG